MGRIIDYLRGSKSGPALGAVHRTVSAEVDGLLDVLVPEWYRENLHGVGGSPRSAERVWAANRCQQMNAQQIATMPLDFHGPDGSEPAWVSNPDPNWYPNGIADAMFSIVDQLYGWGFVLLYVTDRYADGYPRTWTVLDSCAADVKLEGGTRVYTYGNTTLDPDDIIQIDRNPGARIKGTPALKAYAQVTAGLMAADSQALAVNSGAYPTVYLQPTRKIDDVQAEKLQNQWMTRTQQRNGAPPVIPPDIKVEELAIDPESLALLDSRQFGASAICTAYGVPSVLLNMALQGGLTYQNPAALGEMWWRFELRPVTSRIADALSNQMLPRGQFVSVRAEDTFAPLTPASPGDDEQKSLLTPAGDTALLTPTPAPAATN